jgi:adenylate cyclase
MLVLKTDLTTEIETILSPQFTIEVTETDSVPHSSDSAITFPNLDAKTQGTKLLETAVLYVDMRRSTVLSLKHRRHTVAKLYSAFVRSMTRCANHFGGEVRGIIGDRVLVLFEPKNCFTNAVDTAELMNSACQHILNEHFVQDEVKFGIGIDYGRMLATKTGIRRHGAAQQSYRSLVWLGRPANVASKLTDVANKQSSNAQLTKLSVAYGSPPNQTYRSEYPHDFVKSFSFDALAGVMRHQDPRFHSFVSYQESITQGIDTPPILMTQSVYSGFKAARPDAVEIQNGWLKEVPVTIEGYSDRVYGANVIYSIFNS